MTVRLLTDYPPYKAGNLFTSDANTEAGLIAQHMADSNLTGAVAYIAPAVRATDVWRPLVRDKTIDNGDSQNCYAAVNAITVTFPGALIPRPTVCLMPPASGNLTITTPSGTVTRTRANNPNGVTVTPYQESDAYSVSGS